MMFKLILEDNTHCKIYKFKNRRISISKFHDIKIYRNYDIFYIDSGVKLLKKIIDV